MAGPPLPLYGACDASAHPQMIVRRVDDSVSGIFRNIALGNDQEPPANPILHMGTISKEGRDASQLTSPDVQEALILVLFGRTAKNLRNRLG